MSRNSGHRPTIELEPISRDGVWVLRDLAPERSSPSRAAGGLKLLLASLVGAGVAAVALGVVLPSLSQPSWAQAASWHRPALGEASPLRDAVAVGSESGLPLYSCRAAYADGVLVGRYRSDFGGCHIGYNGKEVEVAPFEVLSLSWADAVEGPSMGALGGGEVAESLANKPFASRTVSPCRVSYRGGVHPGSWMASGKTCSFGFGSRAVASENFSVLQSAPWMTWGAGVPVALSDGAVVGGEEGGEPFFICRAPTPRGTLLGKVKASSPGCSVPLDGREQVESRFELLVPHWRVSSGGAVPVGAVVGGREGTNLQYICRAHSRNTVQPGRVSDRLPGCRVGIQGAEVVLQDYEVLSE